MSVSTSVSIHRRNTSSGLGSVRLVFLTEARELAFADRKHAREAGDPLADKRPTQDMPTFAEAAVTVVEQEGGRLARARQPADWRRSLARHVFPAIGSGSVSEVHSADVLGILPVAGPLTILRLLSFRSRWVPAGSATPWWSLWPPLTTDDPLPMTLHRATEFAGNGGAHPAGSRVAVLATACAIVTVMAGTSVLPTPFVTGTVEAQGNDLFAPVDPALAVRLAESPDVPGPPGTTTLRWRLVRVDTNLLTLARTAAPATGVGLIAGAGGDAPVPDVDAVRRRRVVGNRGAHRTDRVGTRLRPGGSTSTGRSRKATTRRCGT